QPVWASPNPNRPEPEPEPDLRVTERQQLSAPPQKLCVNSFMSPPTNTLPRTVLRYPPPSSPSSALTKQPSASTMSAIVTGIEGCSSMTGMGVNTPIHAMTKRISETINTNNFGGCKDI